MSAPQGVVRFLRHGQQLIVQVEGWARMPQCLPIRRLAEQCFAGGAAELRMDLRGCTYMDSTFLGTLLFLKRAVDRSAQGQFALVSPSPECQQLLKQLGLNNAFAALEEEPPAGVWTELLVGTADVDTCRHHVVEAHQELANLDGPAGKSFREVAQGMRHAMEESEKTR